MKIEESKTISSIYNSNAANKKSSVSSSKQEDSFATALNNSTKTAKNNTANKKSADKVNADDNKKDENKKVDERIDNSNSSVQKGKVENKEAETEVEEEKVTDDVSEKQLKDLLDMLLSFINDNNDKKVSEDDMKKVLDNFLNNDLLKGSDLDANEVSKIDDLKKSSDINGTIEQLTKILKTDDTALSKEEQDALVKILNQFDSKSEIKDDTKNSIKDLLMQLTNKSSETNTKIEETLKSNLEDETPDSDNYTDNTDDEFLNKLINKNNDLTSQNINSFASRVSFNHSSTVQNANVVNTTVNAANLADDLIKDVKLMVTDAVKELTVKVNPGNLGQITITLTEENGVMKANLKADSKEAVQLLIQNTEEIKKQLDSQNMKIQEVNIELYQEDTTFYKQGMFNKNFHDEQENASGNVSYETAANGEESDVKEDNMAEEDNNLDLLA